MIGFFYQVFTTFDFLQRFRRFQNKINVEEVITIHRHSHYKKQ